MLLEAPFEKIAQRYREEILSYIRDNMKETTVIVTGYECTRTDLFDKIIELENGTIK